MPVVRKLARERLDSANRTNKNTKLNLGLIVTEFIETLTNFWYVKLRSIYKACRHLQKQQMMHFLNLISQCRKYL